jgi:hypothetical protein
MRAFVAATAVFGLLVVGADASARTRASNEMAGAFQSTSAIDGPRRLGTSPYKLSFAAALSPTAFLDLEASNFTEEEKCVTVNGRPLCTAISSCPKSAYACSDLQGGGSYSCAFDNPSCRCTALWGDQPCGCNVGMVLPYVVSANPTCPNGTETFLRPSDPAVPIDMAIDDVRVDCYGRGEDGSCQSGYSEMEVWFEDAYTHLTVSWSCAAGAACRCDRASYRDKTCGTCQVCDKDAPGAFRLECSGGFSTDCSGANFTLWTPASGGPRGRRHGVFATAAAVGMALGLLWL